MAASLHEDSSSDDVCTWITAFKPDFAKYCSTIRENDVTGGALLYAPLDDVIAMMGVVSVGHRHLLRKEITAVRERVAAITAEAEEQEAQV